MPRSYMPIEGKNVRRIDFPGSRGYVAVTEFPFVTADPTEQAFLDGHPLLEAEDVSGEEPAATEEARPEPEPEPEITNAPAEEENPVEEEA